MGSEHTYEKHLWLLYNHSKQCFYFEQELRNKQLERRIDLNLTSNDQIVTVKVKKLIALEDQAIVANDNRMNILTDFEKVWYAVLAKNCGTGKKSWGFN